MQEGPNRADKILDQAVDWIAIYIAELENLARACLPSDELTKALVHGELCSVRAIHLALESRTYLLDLCR